MKCVRPNCANKAGPRSKGLCANHYAVHPERGYVPAAPVRQRLLELNRAGYPWRRIAEMVGRSEQGLYGIRDRDRRVQFDTAARIMAIPVPDRFTGGGIVDATGTHRRIRALMALGWTQRELESRLGLAHRRLSIVLSRPRIRTPMARQVAALYDELSMTLGPSERTRRWAKSRGFPPPLAWTDIDDPAEAPDVGEHTVLRFPDRFKEVVEVLGLRDRDEIARRLGMSRETLDRQVFRYGLNKEEVA